MRDALSILGLFAFIVIATVIMVKIMNSVVAPQMQTDPFTALYMAVSVLLAYAIVLIVGARVLLRHAFGI